MKSLCGCLLLLLTASLFFSCPAAVPSPADPSAPDVTVYVSASGSDANDGLSPATPKQTLSAALVVVGLSNAQYLRVSGNYTLASGTSNSGFYVGSFSNLLISGGWNANFSNQADPSILNGNSVCDHVVFIENCFRITLTNFVLTGGYWTNGNGGGLYCLRSDSNTIHCIVSNNRQGSGGGIYLNQANGNTISGQVSGNSATNGSGGAIYIVSSSRNYFQVTVSDNSGKYGGAYYLTSAHSNTITGTILNNSSFGGSAGGFRTDFCIGNVVSAVMTNNTATSHGGGILFYNSTNNTVSSSSVIRFNHCDFDNDASGTGGAIHDMNGSNNIIQLGAVYSPNFLGSGTGTTNDLVGIAAP